MSPYVNGTKHLSHWYISGKLGREQVGGGGSEAQSKGWTKQVAAMKALHILLSTWSWCKQGWLCLRHHTDCWLITEDGTPLVVNCVTFHLTSFESLAIALYWQQDRKEKFWLVKGQYWSTYLRTKWFNILSCHIVPVIAWQHLIFARIKKISLCCDSKRNIFWKAWRCTWLSKWSKSLYLSILGL